MKTRCYKYIYHFLLIISNRFNNSYINRYKLFIGTALLLSTSGCQEIKKKDKEEEKEDTQVLDTIQIEKQSEDSIACYIATEKEEPPRKKRRAKTVEIEKEVEVSTYTPLPEIIQDIVCYDPIVCYAAADDTPEFPGGKEALINYISTQLKYPQHCIESGIEGRVVIQFTVEKDGSIIDSKVLASPSVLLSNEVIRVVKQMPKWRPGSVRSKPLRVKHTLPVTFKITP